MTWTAESLRRDEFPFTGDGIYLNAASIGPLPRRTLRAMEQCSRSRAAPFTLTDDQLGPILHNARAAAAALLGADPAEIALTTNTSYGINLAAGMLPLRAGDHVVVSAGEFPANVFPWQHLARRGVGLDLLPVTPEGWPDEEAMLARVADPRVRVLAVSHVQYHTGYRVDLDRLSAACRANDTWLVVDSIQALGVVPFDVRRTPVDILCCGAQKWLLGPWGAGFLYVRREHIPALVPATVGWLAFEGTEDFSRPWNSWRNSGSSRSGATFGTSRRPSSRRLSARGCAWRPPEGTGDRGWSVSRRPIPRPSWNGSTPPGWCAASARVPFA
jgi:selenocysteine lyase/cysteine desulfurase